MVDFLLPKPCKASSLCRRDRHDLSNPDKIPARGRGRQRDTERQRHRQRDSGSNPLKLLFRQITAQLSHFYINTAQGVSYAGREANVSNVAFESLLSFRPQPRLTSRAFLIPAFMFSLSVWTDLRGGSNAATAAILMRTP